MGENSYLVNFETGSALGEYKGINITKFKGKYKDLVIPGELENKNYYVLTKQLFLGKINLSP